MCCWPGWLPGVRGDETQGQLGALALWAHERVVLV